MLTISQVLKHYPEVTGIHPACAAVPVASDEDLTQIIASMKERGLLEPITLNGDGELLDGRHRLIACYEAQVEPRFTAYKGSNPWQYVLDKNAARRHMTTAQKAAFANSMREHFAREAKERQKEHGGTAPGKGKTLRENSPEVNERASDAAGATLGVSGKSVDAYRFVLEHAPAVAKKAVSGEISLNEAYGQARKAKKERDAQERAKSTFPSDSKPQALEEATVAIVRIDGKRKMIPAPKNVRFNQTNDNVDWARWTWNPVTGCEHGCRFCYAREIAHSDRMSSVYPFKFQPAFHEYRLAAPANTPLPKSDDEREGRVFVCSMADLFGKWVPNDWIKAVFDACMAAPDWEYLFLTKWPARYKQIILPKAWYGASVIQQSDVSRIERSMQSFDTDGIKWLSCEPLLTPLKFSDLSWCNLIVIGGQTATSQPDGFVPEIAPDMDWVIDIVNQARSWEVPYYVKANLGMMRPGMILPQMTPRRTP